MRKSLHIALTIAALMVSLCAGANDYILKAGTNKVAMFQPANAMYIATSDSKVDIVCMEVYSVTYKGVGAKYQYANNKHIYEVDSVAAGDTVFVQNGFPMNDLIEVKVMEAGSVTPVELVSTNPTAGRTFPWTAAGMVSVRFNKNIRFNSIKLHAGENKYDVDDIQSGSSIGFNITNALNQVSADSVVAPGEKFSIVISGLRDADNADNLYNNTGELTIEYVMPYPQHNMVEAKVNGSQLNYLTMNDYTFLSYYPVDGEDGVFTFEFDDDVKSVSSVSFTSGNIDLSAEGKYHKSELKYTIEDNKVIVDVRGVLRTVNALFPAITESEEGEEGGMGGTFSPSPITITLSYVLDSHGNAFYSAAPGSIGSYSFSMPYKELEDNVSLDGDNLPSGAEVKTGTEVSIWISDASLKFDGFDVTYFVQDPAAVEGDTILNAQTAHVADYQSEPDAIEGVIVTFTMPDIDEAFEGSTVRVSLKDAATNDGMPHSLYIEYVAGAKEAAAIEGVNTTSKKNEDIYSINGAKISSPAVRGIYVVGGRKILLQ